MDMTRPTEFPKTEGEPPKKAFLQLETGMHHSAIRRIAIDRDDHFLITGSKDKTLRVWNVQNGELINILRPPLGKNKEGEIYAVAISPGGNLIACGGWTGDEWDHTFSIYFFDREKARMVGLIAGIPAAIHHLAFSKNGEYLAASLALGSGVRVYQVSDFSLYAMDKDYGSDSYWVDFDSSNRLVTTAADGFIRLYNNNFQLLQKTPGKNGKLPYGVQFSPNGEQIAVGYTDSRAVDVFSGEKGLFLKSYLDYKYSAKIQGVSNGNLKLVHFSRDGKFLYAAGQWQKQNKSIVRKWKTEGDGKWQDYPTGIAGLNDFKVLANGKLLTVGNSPSFELIDTTKQRIFLQKSPSYSFRELENQFYTNNDGKLVRFKNSMLPERFVEFSLPNRKYRIIENDTKKLHRPINTAFGVLIKEWQDKSSFTLNGDKVELSAGERIQSYTISPNEKLILIGTDNSLYQIDIKGKIQWKSILPDTVWSVVYSHNMKNAMVALGDGTIRWYRVTDGKEILAVFLHSDGKRWLIFTPSGFYDTNDNNGELLGWTINQARKNAALFLPGFALNTSYKRPEIIQKLIFSNQTDTEILQTLDMKRVDIPEFMTTLYESIELPQEKKTLADGKIAYPVAKIFSTNPISKEIIIAYKEADKLFKPFDRLFVFDEDKKIYLKVSYPMHTMTKCSPETEDSAVLNRIKLNSTVYLETTL